jgi:hypothetical protein
LRQRKRKTKISMVLTITATIVFIAAAMCACANRSNDDNMSPELQSTILRIDEIHSILQDLSDSLREEQATGSEYLDESDRRDIENIRSSLNQIEEDLYNYSSIENNGSEVLIAKIGKETLNQVLETINNYILIRDACPDSKYNFMVLANANMEYYQEARFWIRVLTGKEDNPYNDEQLMALLLKKYLESARGYSLLGYYYSDRHFFSNNKQEMMELIDDHKMNLKRIVDEVDRLSATEELSPLKEELLGILEELIEENDYIVGIDWPIYNVESLDTMLQEGPELRDAFNEKLDIFINGS